LFTHENSKVFSYFGLFSGSKLAKFRKTVLRVGVRAGGRLAKFTGSFSMPHCNKAIEKRTHWVYYIGEVMEVNIREMRTRLGDTQREFASRYNIPFRTVQNWESGVRKPPKYIMELLESRIQADLVNRKTTVLPSYSPQKSDLPKRRDYVGALAWLRDVQECIGERVVFALDEALMCQGNFSGRSDEFVVWVYGDDTVSRFNGVVVLGNQVSPYNVKERGGLLYTDFNRTVADSLANEAILDMQGITEAISKYYYRNGESLEGISVAPEYQERFEVLAQDAIDYYGN
jgi:DNA-binding transcriptional regulator YiaG